MAKNTRREFLIATAGVGVGVWAATGLAQTNSPDEKLNLGFIGVNGRGAQNMGEMAGENVVARHHRVSAPSGCALSFSGTETRAPRSCDA